MKQFFILTFYFLRSWLMLLKPNGAKALASKNIMLRKQLLLATRNRKRAPNLSSWQRLFFAVCTLFISPKRLAKVAILVKPAVLLRFHKALVKRKYKDLFSSKSKRKPGPKGPSQELINVILEMKRRNPRFGCRRIGMQISDMFGVDIDKDVVWRVLSKYYKPFYGGDGPSWLTFLGHTKDSLWSIDFFRCESITLKSHWVMVVMDQFTRRIIGFATHCGDVDGIAACCMFNKIISKHHPPKYLSSDNDPLFTFHRWKANLRVMDIKEIKSIPYQPTSHPFVERLIRTCRNEVLDRTLFWTKSDLQQKLDQFQQYFNNNRTHLGINGNIPKHIAENTKSNVIDLKNYRWKSHCRGLFQLPTAA